LKYDELLLLLWNKEKNSFRLFPKEVEEKKEELSEMSVKLIEEVKTKLKEKVEVKPFSFSETEKLLKMTSEELYFRRGNGNTKIGK
jgi:hypothetical protein